MYVTIYTGTQICTMVPSVYLYVFIYIFFGAQQNIVRYMFGLFKLLYLFNIMFYLFLYLFLRMYYVGYFCYLFIFVLCTACIICWFESLSNQFLTHFLLYLRPAVILTWFVYLT